MVDRTSLTQLRELAARHEIVLVRFQTEPGVGFLETQDDQVAAVAELID